MIFRPGGGRNGGRGGFREYEASVMKRLVRKCGVLLCLSMVFQFFGCLGSGVAREFLIDGVKHAGFEFLLDNDGIADLFADS